MYGPIASEMVALTLTVENEETGKVDTIYYNGLCNSSLSIRPLHYKFCSEGRFFIKIKFKIKCILCFLNFML